MTNNNEPTLLTTEDNPYNPFTHWDEWYTFDTHMGYNTCGLLARIANPSETLNDGELQAAKAEIVRYNLSTKHILVTEKSFNALLKTQTHNEADGEN